MNTPQDIWALCRFRSVERVTVEHDGVNIVLNSPIGFNMVSGYLTLSEPEKINDEYVSSGEVDGHPVRVSLPINKKEVS